MMIRIDEFSRYPAGRTDEDGDFNGSRFREHVLLPAVREAQRSGENLEVIFDGVRSYGSSFLEEAFGGLVRVNGVNKRWLRDHLVMNSASAVYRNYIRLANRYISNAKTPVGL